MISFVCDKSKLAAALEHIAVTVSRKAYTVPTDSEEKKKAAKRKNAAEIQNEFRANPQAVECDLNTFAEYMGTGHCMRGEVHDPQNDTNTNKDGSFNTADAFIKQNAMFLDLDNKDDTPRPEFQTADGVREFINKTISEYIGQPVNVVSIVSESVSSTAELRKWHVVIVLETVIEEYKRAERLLLCLVDEIFKDIADGACTDPSHLMFGCKPEQITQTYDGYLNNEVLAVLEAKNRAADEKRRIEAEKKAAEYAASIAKRRSTGIDTEMTADRLAAIILNSRCDFGKGKEEYKQWVSATAALYYVAHVPSNVIAIWSESYDGTPQNEKQWINRINSVGTTGINIKWLKWAAKLLNPTAFNSYKDELNAQLKALKPNHSSYFLKKKAKEAAEAVEPAVTTAAARADFAELIEQDAEQSDGTREPAAVPTDTPAELTAEDTDGGAPAAEDPAEAADDQSEEPAPVIEDLEKIDFIKGKAIYDYIGHFLDDTTGELDEIGLTDYCGELEARAEELKCKSTYRSRISAYLKELEKAAKIIKEQHTAARLDKLREELPVWVIPTQNGVNKIDEIAFTDSFVEKHGEIRCINGTFYDVNGELPRNQLENMIHAKIRPYITQGVAFRTHALCDCLALKCYSEPIQPDPDKIHVKNGTLTYTTTTKTDSDGNEYAVSGFEFSPNKEFCLCRMDVEYKDTIRRPDKWRAFLDELLAPEDQETLREYMGYCMLPTTTAQKALFIIGNGGEGKSVIGTIMQSIFGCGMVSGQVHKLDNGSGSRFALAALVNRLVMCDDDIKLGALEDTATFKQIVTARIPLEVEQKGIASYQALLFSRIIAFGNGALSSLYDNSDGFWRRQLILSVKPKDPNRKDNKNLGTELSAEKDLIFNWALHGLERLMKNNFEFTMSDRTKQNLEEQKRESNSIIPFMESGAVVVDGDRSRCITSADLYDVYNGWCDDNALYAKTRNTFIKYLRDNAKKYNIEFSYHVPKPNGGRARGFIGIGDMSPIPPTT